MKVKEIGFVAVPVTEMARSRKFYEDVLGLRESRVYMEGKWVEYDLGAGTLALVPASEEWGPSEQGTGFAFEMEDFDQAVAELRAAGVKFVWEPFESPVCHMALVQDPDGNKIGIHKLKETKP
ncbi:MAG: VOC family protein [Verrucomicrobiota bacterium]|nr:VOC family protein [Verrucomicrobiota bacterium]